MPPTLLDELRAAAQGCLKLVVGDRRAADYFDFSLRGLVGSFIASLVGTTLGALLPFILGLTAGTGSLSQPILANIFMYAIQIGASALVLRQIGRLDGLIPYVVADNWMTFFVTLAVSLLTLMGVGGEPIILMTGILVLVVEINIARLIVTLTPWQIAAFIGAQLVSVMLAVLVIGAMMPVPTDLPV